MRFVPRVDVLESKISLSDLVSAWTSIGTTTTLESVTTTSADIGTPLIAPIGGVDGTMPTTPGYNLDVYPPALGYGAPGIPQVPAPMQDPDGIFGLPGGAIQVVPPATPSPVPYYPPPYGIPTYVTLSGMNPTVIS